MWLASGGRAANAQTKVSPSATASTKPVDAVLSGAASRPITSLQVRGVGITVDELSQTEIWDGIVAKRETHTSIYSNVASDYPSSESTRSSNSRLRIGLALKLGAGEAVDYTPLPVFVFGPQKHPENPFGAAYSISGARQQGSLPFHLFIAQQAHNDTGASIEDVFAFFDANPEVPTALIFSTDGMIVRKLLDKPGSGLLPNIAVVPSVFDSDVALLVTRPERVDRLRPFAVNEPTSVDTRETQYDLVKLWNFYWDETEAYDKHYDAEEQARGIANPVVPHTMSSAWWRSRLPALWQQTQNKGPGHFQPDVWAPVRWTDWQFKEFDESPVLGYIERPVKVRLVDDHGAPLREAEQAAALRDGWSKLAGTHSTGTKASRIFFDTTGNKEWVIPLTQALGAEPGAPSTGNVEEGYDIGYRLGNTGVSSGPVQLGLSLMAGYKDGKASAIVNRNSPGYAELVLVTPPTEAEKKHNALSRGEDPFNYR